MPRKQKVRLLRAARCAAPAYCPYCGALIMPGMAVCPHCGAPVKKG